VRNVSGTTLFIGHAGNGRDIAALRRAGIEALIDVAINETPATPQREMVCCRIPLDDGGGNPPVSVRLALDTTSALLKAEIKTLVFCSAGMSRSPAIAAGALSLALAIDPNEALGRVRACGPCDISPTLWGSVLEALQR